MFVKSHLSVSNTLASARQVASNEINLILKSFNTKEASGTNKIPTKLVKLASNFLSKPLVTAINNRLASSKFPVVGKVATVIAIDKKDKWQIWYIQLSTCKFIKLLLESIWKHYNM